MDLLSWPIFRGRNRIVLDSVLVKALEKFKEEGNKMPGGISDMAFNPLTISNHETLSKLDLKEKRRKNTLSNQIP